MVIPRSGLFGRRLNAEFVNAHFDKHTVMPGLGEGSGTVSRRIFVAFKPPPASHVRRPYDGAPPVTFLWAVGCTTWLSARPGRSFVRELALVGRPPLSGRAAPG